MKVIFVSNYFNHHQKPFSDAIFRRIGDDYIFLAVRKVEKERINMGWKASGFPTYVKQLESDSINDINYWKCEIEAADIVIGMVAYRNLLERRLVKKKMTFLYSERLYKSNLRFLKAPIHWVRALKLRKCYMLCASSYTSFDYSLTRNFLSRCYKWGYFPEVKQYASTDALMNLKMKEGRLKYPGVSILWVSRLIGWKHPELPVLLAARLKSKGYNFKLTMIGVGPLEAFTKGLIKKYDVADCIQLIGKMSPEEVRRHMESSDIFLFTSDRNEGWGAVLNESMSSGCAVVANQKIGSVPYLLQDGFNGMIYRNVNEFCNKVEQLVMHPELRRKLGENAYNTMLSKWNAETACDNFFKLVESIQSKRETPVMEGPCSKADIIIGL